MRFKGVVLPWILLGTIAASCFHLKQPYPKKRHFVLDVSREGEPRTESLGSSLRVRGLSIAPLYEGVEFVYKNSQEEFESDFYNAFFASPDEMISEETRAWLAASGLFDLVVAGESQIQADTSLEVGITALHGDFSGPGRPRAVMGLSFTLSDDTTGIPRVLFHEDLEETASIPSPTPDELVRGWNADLAKILSAAEEHLARLAR